eukprot:15437119-Alexandrium_andersonii.AAC.1
MKAVSRPPVLDPPAVGSAPSPALGGAAVRLPGRATYLFPTPTFSTFRAKALICPSLCVSQA